MTLPRETVLELMALADGELEGETRERVQSLRDADERARRVVEAIQSPALRLWLRDEFDVRAPPADAIASAVFSRIGLEPPRAGPAPRISERSRRMARSSWLAGLALAAGVVVAVGALWHRPAPVVARSDVAPSVRAPSAQGSVAGVEVDEIESPVHGISLFEVRGADAVASANAAKPSTVVIWVDDEPGSQ